MLFLSAQKWYNKYMKNIENTSHSANDRLTEIEYKMEQLIQENEELKAKVTFYEEQIKLSQSQKYGSSSEIISDGQLSIFNEAEKESAKENVEPDIEEITYKRRKGTSKSRKSYKDLEEEEILYTLPTDEQNCPKCNHELHEMKVIVRKELKFVPARVKVVLHKRQVYACRHCDSYENEGSSGSIVVAPMPNPVLPGSLVSPSLLATIMDMKYNKMMPLYRQEQSFIDYGIDISRQNMASWVIKGTERWLAPLFDRLHDYLVREDIVHADETVLNCLDEKDNKTNYMFSDADGNILRVVQSNDSIEPQMTTEGIVMNCHRKRLESDLLRHAGHLDAFALSAASRIKSVSMPSTISSLSVDCRPEQPELLTCAWFALGQPTRAAYVPVFVASRNVPRALLDGSVYRRSMPSRARMGEIRELEAGFKLRVENCLEEARTLISSGQAGEIPELTERVTADCVREVLDKMPGDV